jgi:hypothetical protein
MVHYDYTNPVPLQPPLTSGTAIQSFVDPIGDWWVAKNGVNNGDWKRARDVLHAKVYRAAAFSTVASSAVVPMDTVDYDPYGMSASSGLVPPIPGIWMITSRMGWNNGTSTNWYSQSIFVGGNSLLSGGQFTGNASAWPTNTVSTHGVFIAASTAVQLYQNSNAAGTAVSVGIGNTFLTINYLGTG